jgi:hypothetical protein
MIKISMNVLFVTDNYSLLTSPKFFREFELPYLKEVANIEKRNRMSVLKIF